MGRAESLYRQVVFFRPIDGNLSVCQDSPDESPVLGGEHREEVHQEENADEGNAKKMEPQHHEEELASRPEEHKRDAARREWDEAHDQQDARVCRQDVVPAQALPHRVWKRNPCDIMQDESASFPDLKSERLEKGVEDSDTVGERQADSVHEQGSSPGETQGFMQRGPDAPSRKTSSKVEDQDGEHREIMDEPIVGCHHSDSLGHMRASAHLEDISL